MIKIITGFNSDQKYSIPDDEAHKAYYLFLNPEKRGVFSNGLALVGKHIQSIEPDYHGTMGWNPTHKLDDYDWNDIRSIGTDIKLRNVLQKAKEVAYLIGHNPTFLSMKLSDIKSLESLESGDDPKLLN